MDEDAFFPDQPVFLDLPMVRGDTFGPQNLVLKYTNDTAVDLTGYDVEIAYGVNDCWAWVWKRTSDGSLVLPDPTTGTVPLYLTKTDTRCLPLGQRARWALRAIRKDMSEGESEKTLFVGRLIVSEGSDWHGW